MSRVNSTISRIHSVPLLYTIVRDQESNSQCYLSYSPKRIESGCRDIILPLKLGSTPYQAIQAIFFGKNGSSKPDSARYDMWAQAYRGKSKRQKRAALKAFMEVARNDGFNPLAKGLKVVKMKPEWFMAGEEAMAGTFRLQNYQTSRVMIQPKPVTKIQTKVVTKYVGASPEPRRIEPRTGPRRVEPRVEPRRVEPRHVEPRRVEPRIVEPRRVEPRIAEPRKAPRKVGVGKGAEPKPVKYNPIGHAGGEIIIGGGNGGLQVGGQAAFGIRTQHGTQIDAYMMGMFDRQMALSRGVPMFLGAGPQGDFKQSVVGLLIEMQRKYGALKGLRVGMQYSGNKINPISTTNGPTESPFTEDGVTGTQTLTEILSTKSGQNYFQASVEAMWDIGKNLRLLTGLAGGVGKLTVKDSIDSRLQSEGTKDCGDGNLVLCTETTSIDTHSIFDVTNSTFNAYIQGLLGLKYKGKDWSIGLRALPTGVVTWGNVKQSGTTESDMTVSYQITVNGIDQSGDPVITDGEPLSSSEKTKFDSEWAWRLPLVVEWSYKHPSKKFMMDGRAGADVNPASWDGATPILASLLMGGQYEAGQAQLFIGGNGVMSGNYLDARAVLAVGNHPERLADLLVHNNEATTVSLAPGEVTQMNNMYRQDAMLLDRNLKMLYLTAGFDHVVSGDNPSAPVVLTLGGTWKGYGGSVSYANRDQQVRLKTGLRLYKDLFLTIGGFVQDKNGVQGGAEVGLVYKRW